MRAKKDRRIPAPEELPSIFDEKCIRELAQTARLPHTADIPRFAAAVMDAARLYVSDASIASDNEVYHEVDGLLRAADRAVKARKRKDAACEIVAVRIERLSERTRNLLNEWGTLPDPEALRDPATQCAACETIARLCRIGAGWREGRRRAGGKRQVASLPNRIDHAPSRIDPSLPRRNFEKRSITMVSVLHAPPLQQHPARREAQLNFVMWLQIAYLEAAGKPPPATAHSSRPSPFAKMAQICLDKLQAGANAVEMVNNLQRWRNDMQLRQTPVTSKPLTKSGSVSCSTDAVSTVQEGADVGQAESNSREGRGPVD